MAEYSGVFHMFGDEQHHQGRAKVVRNRLNLPQRIEVIKQFKKTPDINHLAEVFKCGPRQIKNIMRKRKKYMAMWMQSSTICDAEGDEMEEEREEESSLPEQHSIGIESSLMSAVGFVLYEWVQRARCYQINIVDDILRNFALEIADHIEFKGFRATGEWLAQFKQTYNIDLNVKIKQEAGTRPQIRKPLSISLIIADLRREYGDHAVPSGHSDKSLIQNTKHRVPVTNKRNAIRRSIASESCDSALQLDNDDSNNATGYAGDVLPAVSEIQNYKQALNQLGPLEQFALLKEHVRAVGLINQLENIFREEMVKREMI